MGSYYLGALALVLAIPIVALVVVGGTVVWARDVVTRAPVVGSIGAIATMLALANVFAARACGAGVNRPIIAITLADEACRRTGFLAFAVVLLLGSATASVVRLPEQLRR